MNKTQGKESLPLYKLGREKNSPRKRSTQTQTHCKREMGKIMEQKEEENKQNKKFKNIKSKIKSEKIIQSAKNNKRKFLSFWMHGSFPRCRDKEQSSSQDMPLFISRQPLEI